MTDSLTVVQSGLQNALAEGLPSVAGRRIGLITNHTAVDRQLRSAVDLLHERASIDLVALFGPEHGVRGDAQAGVMVRAAADSRTGLPIYSLYDGTRHPTPKMLSGLDAFVFDIQDIGVRYATYISTMVYAQEAASEAGLPFLVLDRPNPINGNQIEGNVLEPKFVSFVGVHPIPIRHGMTAGELARLVANERGWPEPLIVPMRGWSRAQWFDQSGLTWIQPSPNLPTLDSVSLYPGTCLIEGTNLSEGRGTTRPFELIGAPWLDPFRLATKLEKRTLPGCAFRPAFFTPTFSKHMGNVCGGVQVHITDRDALRPAELGVHLLEVVRTLDPGAFSWRQGKGGRYFVDLLAGSDQPRRLLDRGTGAHEIVAGWTQESSLFAERRRPFLLYA
ncbi:MAG: exo-beta-N-acetylmuramidase NamZ domain-containing protein [Thermomicrobiales bacterium]